MLVKNQNPTKYIKICSIIVVVLAIAGYSLFQARNVIQGPVVEIHSPENGTSLSESLISIEGIAKNISHISLNGRPIFIDERGRFAETLLLSYGYNIMTVKASDKFGKEIKKTLELVYK